VVELVLVSLLNLIQHPDEYHGKRISVAGFATFEFEGKAIYPSKDDYERADTKKALWIEVKLTEPVRGKNKQYVIVEGTFDKNSLGHLKMFAGTITDIQRIELKDSDKAPR
jgi:hypothetical protein